VGARTERDFWQTFFKNNEPAKGAVPFGVVLTIPATGSELDKSAVITNWATSEKIAMKTTGNSPSSPYWTRHSDG